MLFAALPVSSFAASEEEHQRIRDQIADTYRRTLSATGTSSLHGYCGMMAGWELYLMGITTSAVTHNGNEMYDILSTSDKIAEGYTPVCYDEADYDLEGALNAVSRYGTKDVYNILIGFQWTTTAAGRYYGHVTIVHAILDGMVYFTEGFVTPFQDDPSQAMVCSIQEFAEHYNRWTGFEGLIHFDTGIAIPGCDSVACDLFVSGNAEIALRTEPNFETEPNGRTVPAGERLAANALCRNLEGVLFYQIMEDGNAYYVPADQVRPVWFAGERVTLQNPVLPQQLQPGEHSQIGGILVSDRLEISNVIVSVTDKDDQAVLYQEAATESKDVNLDMVDRAVDFSLLREGSYILEIACDVVNPYSLNGEIVNHIRRVVVSRTVFTVGNAEPVARAVAAESAAKNGWQLENDNWYYYENGAARTGWFCDNGIDYYLLENGAAATGWQEINGKNRYFSETGAMRTGWLETEEGTRYMRSNGVAVTGLMEIGESLYFFGETGLMVSDSTVEFEGQTYEITADGIASLITQP